MPQPQKPESASSSKSSTKKELPSLLAVGRLTKPHGTRGEIALQSLSGETEHLLRLTSLTLRRAGGSGQSDLQVTVEEVRRAHNRVLIKLAGYDSPESLASLRGMEVWVPRQFAAQLRNDEYYVADLVGCAVYLAPVGQGGEAVGTVVGVIEGPSDDFLEVYLGEGATVLVPFREQFVGTVDPAARRLQLIDPEILE